MSVTWTRVKEPGCILDIQYRDGAKGKRSWRVRFSPERGPLKGKRQVVLLRKGRGAISDWKEAQKLAFTVKTEVELGQGDKIEKEKQSLNPLLTRAEDLIEDLIESKRRKAEGTYHDIRYYCRTYIIPYFNDHCPYASEFSQAHWDGEERGIVSFLSWFQEEFPGYSIHNVKKYFGMVHKKFMSGGLLKKPVTLEVDEKRVSPGKRLTTEEAHRLIEATYSLRNPYGPYMRLALMMALHMGMRRGEITNLKWDRIDLIRGEIALRSEDTKIRKAREFAISEPVLFALRGLHNQTISPYVFPNRDDYHRPITSFKTAWTKVREMTGIQCRFHDLRHTFLSEALLTHKMDPLKVAVFAGVSLHVIETVYLHPRADDTREVMQAISRQFGAVALAN